LVIKYVQPADPDEAKAVLEGLYASATDPDDGLDDLGVDGLDDAETVY
jgi:hypothetical protein